MKKQILVLLLVLFTAQLLATRNALAYMHLQHDPESLGSAVMPPFDTSSSSQAVLDTSSVLDSANVVGRTVPNAHLELTSAGDFILSWDHVPAASAYKVYGCLSPAPFGSDAWQTIAVVPAGINTITIPFPDIPMGFVCVTYNVPAQPVDDLIYIPGGTVFINDTQHNVNSFYLDIHEVTQSEFRSLFGYLRYTGHGLGDAYPVYGVSWYDAIEYCNKRSIYEGLTPCYSYGAFGTYPGNWPPGWNAYDSNTLNVSCNWNANGYRLLTRAESLFAAKGGNLTHAYIYSGSNNYDEVAWCSNNAGGMTHPVGTKAPNELGIYDLSGNVMEWLWDYYSDAMFNYHRALMSGAWNVGAEGCMIDLYWTSNVTYRNQGFGLRVCRKV